MSRQLLDRYCTDRSPQAGACLVETYYALVASVCRRYLRQPQDVDDAVQETFIKLLHHADSIHGDAHGDVRGWLTTAAYFTCIDLIRRSASQRNRQQDARHLLPSAESEHWLVHEAISAKLHEALSQLAEADRELVIDRFVRKTPLRVIAGRRRASMATISRRTSRVVGELAAVLRDMGVTAADDLTVAEHFGDPANLPADRYEKSEGLRFAPDWSALPSLVSEARPPVSECLPGWNRPIRVGAFISYASNQVYSVLTRSHLSLDAQVHSTQFLCSPAFELVGIIEPGTADVGSVERTMRQFELTAGLIDAADAASLATLDVILLGINFAISRPIVHAINQAVRGGVGLLKEWWMGQIEHGGQLLGTWSDREAAELLLADSAVHNFHMKQCSLRVMGTVQEEHELIPGLARGAQVVTEGCGPVYRASPHAKVLVTKNYVVPSEQHNIPGVGAIAPAAYLAGQLSQGRVVVVQAFQHGLLWSPAMGGPSYLTNVLAWLAEPRRQSPQAAY